MGDSAEENLETSIRSVRKVSLDGTKAVYDLTSGIDFSRPRRTAEAIAKVVWEQDARSWWNWRGGDPIFEPHHKVELRLPRDHDRKVARAAEEFREDLKKHELAPFVDSYLYQQRTTARTGSLFSSWGRFWRTSSNMWTTARDNERRSTDCLLR